MTVTVIWVTFSVGNPLAGRDVGAPRIGVVSLPDTVVKVTSSSTILVDGSLTSRTTAPLFGIWIMIVGLLSVKSTPFVIKSCVFRTLMGVERTEFVVTRVLMYSISWQYFPVVAPEAPVVSPLPLVVWTGAPAVVPGAALVVAALCAVVSYALAGVVPK
jgi:hypothetical protein